MRCTCLVSVNLTLTLWTGRVRCIELCPTHRALVNSSLVASNANWRRIGTKESLEHYRSTHIRSSLGDHLVVGRLDYVRISYYDNTTVSLVRHA